MKIIIKHHISLDHPNNVSHTEKLWVLFGLVLKRKVYHYPKLKSYEVVTMV